MKQKVNRITGFMVIAAMIFSVTVFTSGESKGIETAGVLTLIVSNANLTAGTYAYADMGTNHYNAVITGSNRIGFAGMPAGSYRIYICAQTTTGPHNYAVSGFLYNGGDQAARIDLKKGFCNPE